MSIAKSMSRDTAGNRAMTSKISESCELKTRAAATRIRPPSWDILGQRNFDPTSLDDLELLEIVMR